MNEAEIRPRIVCLCGSTRFSGAFQKANFEETLAGNIVLTIGCDLKSDADLFAGKSEAEMADIKARLDDLHLRKIDLVDEVLILNCGGYIGQSTRRELKYAQEQSKVVRFLENRCPECGSEDVHGVDTDRDVVMICRVCNSHTVIA